MSADRLKKIRHMALDMDGTLYLGGRLFPWTQDFLKTLREKGIGYTFLTNNPTRSVADYLAKLAGMGIEASEENMLTTSLAAIDWLKENLPGARRLFMLGTPSMVSQFEKAGYEPCADDPADRPDALVVSFDMTLTYPRLCRAAWWASQGVPYIATNPDRVCPTELETVLVDCGSIQKCIEEATGRRPDIVLGKPDPTMLQDIMLKHGLSPDEVAMVGDRVYTDIAMARNAGAAGILVLSGETTPEILENVPESQSPDFVFDNVGSLAAAL
ncbi:MAG: HAD-IIA family hydrolase [Bacteroidales bacterium]|nr:HAD-IIA family hydrolase [Bacteroidales bacterium]